MLPRRIVLVDRGPELVAAWKETFAPFPEVVAERRDYFASPADAMVAPGNSFAIMDGGLDKAIRDVIGGVEARVQKRLAEVHHAELPVGGAEVVETNDDRWPFLVYAPTMRVPDDVSRSTNAYVAFRAILLAVRRHNTLVASGGGRAIETLLCCGLCTGIGAMPPRRSAAQMRVAYRQVLGTARPPSFREIHETHIAMRTAE